LEEEGKRGRGEEEKRGIAGILVLVYWFGE